MVELDRHRAADGPWGAPRERRWDSQDDRGPPMADRGPPMARRRGCVLAVTSGKGGVGKTTLSANLAAALAALGLKVIVLDADLGLANLDVLLHLQPRLTLHEVLHGRCTLAAAVVPAPMGFSAVLAGSGLVEYSRMTPALATGLRDVVEALAQTHDVVLLDTGAGISEVVLHTISLAQEVLVVATPEPTSLTDAYATIKVLSTLQQRRRVMLLVNQVTRSGEGLTIFQQLQAVVQRYLAPAVALAPQLRLLGELPLDEAARQAVRQRSLVLQIAPGSTLAQGLRALALRLSGWLQADAPRPSRAEADRF